MKNEGHKCMKNVISADNAYLVLCEFMGISIIFWGSPGLSELLVPSKHKKTCLEFWLSEYLRMSDNYLIFRFIQGKFRTSSTEADNGKEKEEKRNRIPSLHMNFS